MSEVNLNFALTPVEANLVVTTNDISFTPAPINMTFYTGSAPIPPAGPAGNAQVQYNNNGVFDGSNSFVFNNTSNTVSMANANVNILSANNFASTGGNISLGTVTKLRITGGTNGYVLQTDGTGNLGWTAMSGGGGGNGTPGGSNTQVQFNNAGTFGGTAGFTYNTANSTLSAPYYYGNGSALFALSGGSVVGAVYEAFHANAADVANSVAGSNVVGAVSSATTAVTATTAVAVSGNVQANITSTGTLTGVTVSGVSNLGLVGNVRITGGSAGQYLTTSGDGNLSFTTFNNYGIASAQYNLTGTSVAFATTDELWNFNFPTLYDPATSVGVTWSGVSSNISTTTDLQDVNYGGGLYIAVGNAGAITSSTSATGPWINNSVSIGSNIFYTTTYSDTLNQWIAMGQNGYFSTSTAANSWTTSRVVTTDAFLSVAWGLGKYIAITSPSGNVYTSTNGTSWSVVATGKNYSDILFDGTKFRACGIKVDSTTDGITWTSGAGGGGSQIAYVPSTGMYVTCASGGALYYSTDGIDFYAANVTWGTPIPNLNGIAGSADGFVCGGNTGRRAYSSDGINWTVIPYVSAGNAYTGMCQGNGYFIALQTQALISYTASSITRYVFQLPAHTGYSAQTLTWTPVAGGDNVAQATSLSSAITALRSTYTTTFPSAGVALIDTNSDGNITDLSFTITGYVPSSPMVLTITQGTGTLDKITLTDPVTGQTLDYYPYVGQTNGSIGNEISYRETLSNWNMSVAASSTLGAKVNIQINVPQYVATASFPTLTVVNGTGSTLTITRTIFYNGL